MSDPALVQFVRDVLGCGCADEVLRSIKVDRGRLVPGFDQEITRLDVGGRLLVWVAPVAAVQTLRPVVARALEAGLADRDAHAFNRVRLVLATAEPTFIEATASEAFDAWPRPDDRVHLHVVDLEDLPRMSSFP